MQCDRQKDGDLCYKQMSYIDEWLNKDEVKTALGVPVERTFESESLNSRPRTGVYC